MQKDCPTAPMFQKPMKKKQSKKIRLVEIVRSFSFKQNLGNYEMADHFCSQKAECKESEKEKTSEALYTFCKNEVMKSVNQFRQMDKKKIKDNARTEAEYEKGDTAQTALSEHEEYLNAH